ncbi:hypothetical protein ABZ215_03820 [Amycolatopsis sp. NPDC006131]|uniref:hypothetical protein n=1 Tax=Amycolatopsis sp. NPDC006131 TaxID=3156731 RepID=UPI0033BD1209
MIHLGTAALVKLIRRAPESDALADWLATAQAIFGRHLTAFVTYDKRLAGCARSMGLPAIAPA